MATGNPQLPGVANFEIDTQTSKQAPPAYPGSNIWNTRGEMGNNYLLPNSVFEKDQWDSDAKIATRKAMAKRSSKSFAARASRMKSRREKHGKPAKPGIKVDTSVSRHKGSAPRQVYPWEGDIPIAKSNGTVKKTSWRTFGRSATRSTKGLGITRGSGQTTITEDNGNVVHPRITTYRVNGTQQYENPFATYTHDRTNDSETHPRTADSLTPGTRAWMEVSPSDAPIPIGISIPTDSIADFSPYQSTRGRSESDATLATPSIIITPAAMKSVWSPDTEDDYTPGRSSSLYSQAFNFQSMSSNIPPVPALPTTIPNPAIGATILHTGSGPNGSHVRKGTVDSAVTTFEEDDYKRKERIASGDTMFEEDQTPLTREGHMQRLSKLSIDTSNVPTPRRSRGWWNVITTPFELSRHNSLWTNRGMPNGERTPDVPMVPQRFGAGVTSPPTPSTYIWSATEKSPSERGDSPLIPQSLQTSLPNTSSGERGLGLQTDYRSSSAISETIHAPARTNNIHPSNQTMDSAMPFQYASQTPSLNDRTITSPMSATTASPVLRTAAVGTVLMPHERAREINVNPELKDQRSVPNAQFVYVSPKAVISSAHASPAVNTSPPVSHNKAPGTSNVVFAPPPTVNVHISRSDSPKTDNVRFPPPPTAFNISVSRSQSPEPSNILFPSSSVNSRTQSPEPSGVLFPPPAPPTFSPPPKFTSKSAQSHTYDSKSIGGSSVSSDHTTSKTQHKASLMDWFRQKVRRLQKRQPGVKKPGDQKKRRTRRCCCLWGCCCILIVCLIAIIVPIVVITSRRHNGDSKTKVTPSRWLNLTGYPPIPTGISTIAQPEATEEESGCVNPTTVWSCALPKEDQASIAPNKPDQPNFKLDIIFKNGTVSDPSKLQPVKRATNAVSAGAVVRSSTLNGRDGSAPSPNPPALDDQKFLGSTTDNNTTPFEGEETPFFVSFLSSASSTKLIKRQIGDIVNLIPEPSVNQDGTAAPANLLPLPSLQPLRLYNRGKEEEHYGFYVYYDRSIFLKSIDGTNSTFGGTPADVNGGSRFDAASLRCTWAQTRFLVQIWTRSSDSKPLLQGRGGLNSSAAPESNFKRPGSFPYPVTITIDRHGGDKSKKMIYCYELDQSGRPLGESKNKKFVLEDRAFGGVAVNATDGPLRDTQGNGIDGGSGGCKCLWQNWLE